MMSHYLIKDQGLLVICFELITFDAMAVLYLGSHDPFLYVVHIIELNQSAFGSTGEYDSIQISILAG